MFGVLTVGMVLVAYGTSAKNRWGINLETVSCPCCKTLLPWVRKPQSLRQAMWGGYTCPSCGAEVDKWGRDLTPAAKTAADLTHRSVKEGWWKEISDRLGDVSPLTWIFFGILFCLDIAYDLYHGGALIIDGIILLSVFVWLRNSKNKAKHK